MNILLELITLLENLNIPVETGSFSNVLPDEYVLLTPMVDIFEILRDNSPDFETQEARLLLFTKSNYLDLKLRITTALLNSNFVITQEQYIGYGNNSSYHNYVIDTSKIYSLINYSDNYSNNIK